MNEFERFASLGRGISPMTLHRFGNAAQNSYINPTIIEERKLNMAQLDVFSRLLLDRVIWLGCEIDDDVANICTGMAASMGSVLLCAGQKGKRSALPHSRVMIHQVSGGTGRAQCSDIQIVANEIKKTQEELCSIIAEKSGQSYDKVFADMDRDYWMTSSEALEYGMIDRILGK